MAWVTSTPEAWDWLRGHTTFGIQQIPGGTLVVSVPVEESPEGLPVETLGATGKSLKGAVRHLQARLCGELVDRSHDPVPTPDSRRNRCPACGREWFLDGKDPALLPDCGCYGDDPESDHLPCERCARDHIYACTLTEVP